MTFISAGVQNDSPNEKLASASQGRLIWRRFTRHKLAVVGLFVIGFLYLIALFAEVIAPYSPEETSAQFVFHPPQIPSLFLNEADGLRFFPHAPVYETKRDPASLRMVYAQSNENILPIGFFTRGEPYRLWGLFPTDVKFMASLDPDRPLYLLGTDRLGRDMFSRLVHGARVTMTLGLAGVVISLILGVFLGGISGYYGGRIDWFVQRLIEYILSLPTIPLWMALAAAMPRNWPPTWQYFTITCIVSLIGWTELARVVRGRFLAMRDESFVVAARLDGCIERRVIFKHMLPSLGSHIIASVTLAVPMMIIAETSLSFLGLGLQPPAISWGVLLQEAQNIRTIAQAPWLFSPAVMIIAAVLCFNFVGDGLRDAADPYAT